MDDFLKELQDTFFAEGEQILEDLEQSLLKLEEAGPDEETVNTAFRLMHNFKGSSRSVGFQKLADLAHVCEDLLTKVKSGQAPITGAMITLFLDATDLLKNGLVDLQSDRDSPFDFAQLAARLESIDKEHKETEKTQEATTEESPGFGFFDDEPEESKEPLHQPWPDNNQSDPTISRSTSVSASPKKAQKPDELIRVSNRKLDSLINLVGELVVNQTILHRIYNQENLGKTKMGQTISYLNKTVADIQSVSMSLKLVPVRPVFQKMRRAVRDVAQEVQKDIDFIEIGDHVEIDKTVVDKIIDPLTHMVRNAVDHGIESSGEREQCGKPAKAKVTLAAIESDDQVIISLQDDGKGMDRNQISQKAVEKKLVAQGQVQSMSDQEVFALIFRPGFSTKEKVTAISGRGVGMEVVQKAVEDLKGTIQVDSKLGMGTTFKISLPLSLSIVGGMVVKAANRNYIIPMSQLLETIELSRLLLVERGSEGKVVQLRDCVMPVYDLAQCMKQKPANNSTTNTDKRPALVTIHQGQKLCFSVEQIIGQQQVVLKKLGREFQNIPGIMGGAILSNGDPGLVLNLKEIKSGGRFNAA